MSASTIQHQKLFKKSSFWASLKKATTICRALLYHWHKRTQQIFFVASFYTKSIRFMILVHQNHKSYAFGIKGHIKYEICRVVLYHRYRRTHQTKIDFFEWRSKTWHISQLLVLGLTQMLCSLFINISISLSTNTLASICWRVIFNGLYGWLWIFGCL